MTLKIKADHTESFVAFGGGGKKKLGERSQDDLLELAIMAHSNKNLKRFFDGELPNLAALQKEKLDKQNASTGEVAKAAPKAKVTE